MIQLRLRKYFVWIGVAAAGLTVTAAHAQQQGPPPSGPAPILVTVREMPKPGEEATHAKLEAEYATAMDADKAKQYYLGMGEISGSEQTMFLSGYASLEEMQAVHDYDDALIGDKLDSLEAEHNATLLGSKTAIWRLRPDLSNPEPESLGTMRFMDLIQIHVKLGHDTEFSDVIRKTGEIWIQTDPSFHFTIYQEIFGNSKDDTFLIVFPVKSLADLDKHQSLAAEYMKNMGADTHKKILGIESADYNSIESNLYVFSPSMSRLPDTWTKNDMDFWHPKPLRTAAASKTTTTGKTTTAK